MKSTDFYLGIDLGGTKIHAVLATPAGQVLERVRVPTEYQASTGAITNQIKDAARSLLEKVTAKTSGRLLAAGLLVPGPIDFQKNIVDTAPNLPIGGADFCTPLNEEFDIPVFLNNDVDGSILGEYFYGPSQNVQTTVGIYPGTGIGGGIVISGAVYRGKRFSAAEIGHILVKRNGPLCGCKTKGCLEAVASRTAIERVIRKEIEKGRESEITSILKDGERIKSRALARALAKKDPLVCQVVRKASEYLGMASVTLRHILDPELIIFGGGLIEACGTFMLPIIQEEINASPHFQRHPLRLAMATLGDDSGVLGAIATARTEADKLNLLSEEERARQYDSLPWYPQVSTKGDDALGKKESSQGSNWMVLASGEASPLRRESQTPLVNLAALKQSHLRKIVEGGPHEIVIALPDATPETLDTQADAFPEELRTELDWLMIRLTILPAQQACDHFNQLQCRRAFVLIEKGEK